MKLLNKQYSVLPGFGPTLGFTLAYLGLVVLIPLGGLFIKTAELSWNEIWVVVSDARAIASYKLSLGASALGALLNAFFGFIVAWSLVRYRFPFQRVLDALIDLPFALPTAVSGIALTTIFAKHGWLGQYLEPMGIKVAFAPLGVLVALTFIGLPFVVRTLQPAMAELDAEYEEAAASLGATRWKVFTRVIFPQLFPALATGFALSFARALGEYGSVVFISGNMPMKTEITPLLIITKLEQYDYSGATAIAVVMLLASFFILLSINILQWWNSHRYQRGGA